MEDKLLTTGELADVLGTPAKTIRNKLSDGTWPLVPVRIGRAVRWRRSDAARIISGEIVVPSSSK